MYVQTTPRKVGGLTVPSYGLGNCRPLRMNLASLFFSWCCFCCSTFTHTVSATLSTRCCFLREQLTNNMFTNRPHPNFKHLPLRIRHHKGKQGQPPRPTSLLLLSKYKKQSDVRIYVQTPPENGGTTVIHMGLAIADPCF